MDDSVLRAMAKWPNVPAVYGWLALDRRGRWLLRDEPIANRAAVRFIDRNYGVDDGGRWYFQNGPQRVFVRLDYTPWVLRLRVDGGLDTHTGLAVCSPRMISVMCSQGPASSLQSSPSITPQISCSVSSAACLRISS